MKGLSRLVLTMFVCGLAVYASPLPSATEPTVDGGVVPRGVIGIGFPSFFHDIKHQFGSIGHDLRKLVTSLMGATQVVYWKPPFKSVRRTELHSHRRQTVGRHPRPVTTTTTSSQPTRRTRRKKAYSGSSDYDDFFSFDSFGFW